MKILIKTSVLILFLLFLPIVAAAGGFDDSTPFICSVIKVVEYTPAGDCREIAPESVGVPQFMTIDLAKKTITPTRKSDGDRISVIKRMERMEGRLILQGSDQGIQDLRDSVGWTATVMEASGKFIVTAAGDQEAFIVYGACTELP